MMIDDVSGHLESEIICERVRTRGITPRSEVRSWYHIHQADSTCSAKMREGGFLSGNITWRNPGEYACRALGPVIASSAS